MSLYMSHNELILPVPVIILEDEPLIQARLKTLLLNIGYTTEQLLFAQTLEQANSILKSNSASFALIDLGLPDGNGIEFIANLKSYDPAITILVISAWSNEDMILQALSTGATGYVLKERDDLEVTMSIKSVLRGGAPIDPFIAQKILKFIQLDATPAKREISDHHQQITDQDILSKREHEILLCVAQGLSNKEIAEQLCISRHTVESHIKHIYRKLAVSNRTKAVDTARSKGLIV